MLAGATARSWAAAWSARMALCFAYPNNRLRILCICPVFMSATSKPKLYNPRHPERTLLYQTVAEHYETWLGAVENQAQRLGGL